MNPETQKEQKGTTGGRKGLADDFLRSNPLGPGGGIGGLGGGRAAGVAQGSSEAVSEGIPRVGSAGEGGGAESKNLEHINMYIYIYTYIYICMYMYIIQWCVYCAYPPQRLQASYLWVSLLYGRPLGFTVPKPLVTSGATPGPGPRIFGPFQWITPDRSHESNDVGGIVDHWKGDTKFNLSICPTKRYC